MEIQKDWLTEEEKRAYDQGVIDGLELAAIAVESHWNNAQTLVNQKEQAARSAGVIRSFIQDAHLRQTVRNKIG